MAGTTIEITEYHSPDNVIHRFTSGAKFLLSEEGLGMPSIRYITQKGPYQHGETYLGYALEPRVIQMLIRQNGCSRQEYWANRSTVLDMLRPNRQTVGTFEPGVLRKIFQDGSMRDIDVFIQDGPIFTARSLDRWDEWGYQEAIRFIAPDPTFYDPTIQIASASLTTSDSLVFYNAVTGPAYTDLDLYNRLYGVTSTGLRFDSGSIFSSIVCTTVGSWTVFPDIYITGPALGVIIENKTTGEILRINYDLQTGYNIHVDLHYGRKRVYVVETDENIIGTLSTDSDLSTFHLEPEPGAIGGANNIEIYAGNAIIGLTEIQFRWNDRYIGI
jgi:hypothetical protein